MLLIKITWHAAGEFDNTSLDIWAGAVLNTLMCLITRIVVHTFALFQSTSKSLIVTLRVS